MTFALALTQAPQHSYYNGANTATARQYYLRPTQHTPSGPRIAAGTAGMVAGEFRTLWASTTDNIFSVQTEDNGLWYPGLDWTPRAAWDAATEQIIVGMRRGNYKVSAYSDLTGDWRELPMPATLGRYLNGTAHYYGMIDEDGSGGVYLGSTDEQRMYRLDPASETYTQIASHVVSNGHNGAMLAWDSAAGALHKYVGDAQRFLRYDPGTNSWSMLASSIGNGAHALMEYNPAADRFLIVGGSGTSSRATLVTPAGAKIRVTDAPQPSSMSSGSWIAYHPAGCWLFKGWPETGDQRLYAVWPNAAKTDVIWQDLGVAPDNGLTYSTAAVDYDRNMIYIVSTTGLHAYKMPEVTDPSGGAESDLVIVSATSATTSDSATVSQTHVLLVADALSATTSEVAQAGQGGQHTVTATDATSATLSETASILQTHRILVSDVVSATLSSTASAGAVSGSPTGLGGTPGQHSITWVWEAVSGAAGYEIEYGPVGGPHVRADTGSVTSFEQTGLSGNTPYEARVRSYV